MKQKLLTLLLAVLLISSCDLENPGGCVFRNRCPKANQQCSWVPNLREVSGSIGGHECACHYPMSEAA